MRGIYLIKCNKNNKVYIGQSNNIKQRYNGHIFCLRHNKHPNSHLQKDFNQFGEGEFSCEILHEVDKSNFSRQELYDLEVYYISIYDSTNRDKGYNIESGGNSKGRVSNETKQKLSNSLKGRQSPCYWKGKKMSIELRQKLSKLRKGKPSHLKGKKQTKEHIQKRTNVQFGKVWVNNGIINKFVTKEESEVLLSQGFKLGRKYFTRNTGKYEYKGKRCSLCEIARLCGIDRSVLFYRLKNDWSMEKATTTPIKK